MYPFQNSVRLCIFVSYILGSCAAHRRSRNFSVFTVGLLDGKVKRKVHRTTCHEGTKGEQTYIATLSLISALDGVGWLTPRPGRFTPGNDPVPIV